MQEPVPQPETTTQAPTPSAEPLITARPAGSAAVAPGPRAPQRRSVEPIWSIPMLCLGIGLVALCLLIPQAEANRQLMYEREKIRQDLEHVQKQVATNDDFLKKFGNDPTLAERLAQRQMKFIPSGTQVLDLKGQPKTDGQMSPYLLVNVPPPEPLPPYRPRGWLTESMSNSRVRLYTTGVGLFLIAASLVLGVTGREK